MRVSSISPICFWDLLSHRGGLHLVQHIVGKLGHRDFAVAAVVGIAVERLHQEIAECTVAPAVVHAFEGHLVLLRGQHAEHLQVFRHQRALGQFVVGFRIDLTHVPGMADIHVKIQAIHLGKLIFEQLANIVHRDAGCRQFLWIAVIADDITLLSDHGAVRGDEEKDRVVLAGASFEMSFNRAPHGAAGGLFVDQRDHIFRRQTACARALEQGGQIERVLVSELQRLDGRVLKAGDANQQRVGVAFDFGGRRGIRGGRVLAALLFQYEETATRPRRIGPGLAYLFHFFGGIEIEAGPVERGGARQAAHRVVWVGREGAVYGRKLPDKLIALRFGQLPQALLERLGDHFARRLHRDRGSCMLLARNDGPRHRRKETARRGFRVGDLAGAHFGTARFENDFAIRGEGLLRFRRTGEERRRCPVAAQHVPGKQNLARFGR